MKIIKVGPQGLISLDAFSDFIDISQVHRYDMKKDEESLIITFYNNKGDQIMAKEINPKAKEINPKAINRMKNYNISTPWHVMRVLDMKQISISGEQVCISKDGDFVNLQEMRQALDWIVDQFGGRVRWGN